jgi:uncharacterized protein YbjQ (UPF0145 family)
MKPLNLLAALVLIAAPLTAHAAGPAPAIVVTTQDIPTPYQALGPVRVEIMPTSLMPDTPIRQSLNEALRTEAAKQGADAVIKVVYGKRTFLDKRPIEAAGTAVKYVAPPVQPQAAVAPDAPGASDASSAPDASRAPETPKQTAPVVHAAAADAVIVTSDDIPYRAYTVLGDVSATATRTSIFGKTEPEDLLDASLRDQAFALGADAVVLVQYHMGRSFPSTPSTARGKAVRFD